MKKLFALLLALVLLVSFAACGSQKLTMQQLIDANQAQTLLKTYDSIYIHGTMEGEPYTDYYLTDEYFVEMRDGMMLLLADDTAYAYQDDLYQRVVYLTRDGLVDGAAYRVAQYGDAIISQDSAKEKIQTVAEAEGKITVKSVMEQKDLEQIVGEESLNSSETTYLADAKTYNMDTVTCTVAFDNGETMDILMECSYNVEMPEEMKPILDYYNQTEDLRTITFVFHSGTEKEKVEQIQSPKGLVVALALPKDVATEGVSVYADPACTVPHKSNGDYTSDATIYIK